MSRPSARSSEPMKVTRRPAVVGVMMLNSGMRGRVELQDRVVHRGLVRRHEHRGVGPLRDRARDQRDLLRCAVGLLGHVVRGGCAEPRRGAVGAEPRGVIGRIGAVLGENGDARHDVRIS